MKIKVLITGVSGTGKSTICKNLIKMGYEALDIENIIMYGQRLRFCLETQIKEKYFGYSQDCLSNMIEQVASGGASGIQQLIANKNKILEIYDYCNTGGLAHYPRDGATSWNELKSKVSEYLSLNL